jgi:MoaA/NifB/PqqE/SkfB family radical SAM enzyme
MSKYNYNGKEPVKIKTADMTEEQRRLIFDNPSFCMYPWIHMHAFPTGEAYPCCNTEMKYTVGNTRHSSLEEIWHGDAMRDVRRKMLAGETVAGCGRCYEQEASGFFSMRLSANKHFGHHIALAGNDDPDMKMIYWDIRFSNLCNLRCRSCGHIFSSNWYDDQVKLAGAEWGKNNKRINFAGRDEDDIWQQLEPHIDEMEQVYFAGGEPLIMEEHYRLLHELIRRKKTDVRLIYNTNFSELRYKKQNVLELWKHFDSVSVGASLDGMHGHAEYIRKNTIWEHVEENRRQMLLICPQVDFYISATLSVLNAWHLPDFHRAWSDAGLIKPQDFNINILQDPAFYRIDIFPPHIKERVEQKYQRHLDWLRPMDRLNRASVGFESAIKFMKESDKSQLITKFWQKTHQLDGIRQENILAVIPELGDME